MGEANRRRNALRHFEVGEVLNLNTGQYEEARRTGSMSSWIAEYQKLLALDAIGQKVAAYVPCGSCTACCYYKKVDVDPQKEKAEDTSHLKVISDPDGQGLMLAKRSDGACFHLGPNGCTVHEHRPRACRLYDCRSLAIAAVGEEFDGGRKTPAWLFSLSTKKERLIHAALQMVAQEYLVVHGGETRIAVKFALDQLPKVLPRIEAMVADLEKLPPNELEQVMAEAMAASGFTKSK